MSPAAPERLVERAAQAASARAAEALSELVGQRLTGETQLARDPGVRAGAPREALATRFEVQGFDRSAFVATFDAESLRSVQDLLAPGMGDSDEARDLIAREVGNICVSHFLNSLGDLLHVPLLPSPPQAAGEARASGAEFVIQTDFVAVGGGRIHGTLRFLPDAKLVEALRAAADEPENTPS